MLILDFILSLIIPSFIVPAKSPLTSLKNTGTPASEKLSAKTFKVIVLPLPLAPVISPCLFALFKSKVASFNSFFQSICSRIYT